MKPINFKEANITFAEDHLKYGTLRALKYGEKGHVISCWKLSFKERFRILFFGKVWVRLTSFNKSLPPSYLTTNKKEVIPPPFLTILLKKEL